MFHRCFTLIYHFTVKKKRLLLITFMSLFILSLSGLPFLTFDDNIELMLPVDEEISQSIRFLKKSNLSNKLIISLSLIDPDKTKKYLFDAVDQLANSLKNAELITAINTGLSEKKLKDEMAFFLANINQLITEDELLLIDSRITRENVSQKVKNFYRQLISPGGIFFNSMGRSDPLGIKLMVLEKFKVLSHSTGYKIEAENGHFISKDGRHAMLIIQTDVPVTDLLGIKRLFKELEGELQELPEYIAAAVISGHSHSLSNERIMKRDIRITLIIVSVAFLTLFIVIFGDLRAVIIFLLPLVSIILSINLASFFLGSLSYTVMGLGAVIAGISVDYGVHIYVALQRGNDTVRNIGDIARPVCMGAFTTCGIFFAFFFSHVRGYHQLAFFSILSIAISLLFSLFILPHLLSKKAGTVKKTQRVIQWLEKYNWSNKYTFFTWTSLTALFLFFSFSIQFDGNILNIDGTEFTIIEKEKDFHRVWGDEKLSMVVVTAGSYEKAMAINDKIYDDVIREIGRENFSSISSVWPSEKRKRENLARWKRFWNEGREEKLKKLLKEEGAKYQFSPDAFSPFFNNLYKNNNYSHNDMKKLTSSLRERFVLEEKNSCQIISFFPDREEYLKPISSIISLYDGAFIVSGTSLSHHISKVISRDIKALTMIAAALVCLLVLLFLMNLREAIVSLIPVLTSVIWLFGIMSIFHLKLNAANLISAIVAIGLCIDYGIFIVYQCRTHTHRGITLAVALSALSTVIGAASLLFAKHPALFSVGLTMTIGVGSGYFASFFVIPYIHAYWAFPKGGKS